MECVTWRPTFLFALVGLINKEPNLSAAAFKSVINSEIKI